MAVLQHAGFVIRHVNAKVFLIHAVPRFRQVLHGKGTGYELLFYLIAHHYMQRISKLVRLGTDEGRLGPVCGAEEKLLRYILHLQGEYLLHPWI